MKGIPGTAGKASGHPGPAVVAGIIAVRLEAGCMGAFHLRSPVGGAA